MKKKISKKKKRDIYTKTTVSPSNFTFLSPSMRVMLEKFLRKLEPKSKSKLACSTIKTFWSILKPPIKIGKTEEPTTFILDLLAALSFCFVGDNFRLSRLNVDVDIRVTSAPVSKMAVIRLFKIRTLIRGRGSVSIYDY